MANFNVSFLNPALRKSGGSGVGVLADQLAILENSLGKDGFLSPGDYDILIEKAREIQMSNSLSADQRSNYDVKISGYERAKEVSNLEKTSDIERMNKDIKNEAAEDVMVVGNNPQLFLKARVASLQAKLNDLSEVITQKTAAGNDTTDYYNEYNATLQEYRNKMEATQAMGQFAEDQTKPVQGYVAYVTTNKNGEIVDVDYGKYGDKSGYAETNGMIDGFQVYGKINYKEDGKNYFKLGDKTFTAADMLIQDPSNPGSFKPNKLMADVKDPSGRGIATRAQAGYVNIPGATVQVQSYLPNDSWAKGVNGTIYHRDDTGNYKKYINATEDSLQISGPMLNIPEAFEKSLMRNVQETIDVTAPITPDQGMNMSPMTDTGAQQQAPIKMNYGLDNPFNPSGNQPSQPLPQSSISNPTPSALDMPRANKSQAFRTPQQPSTAAASGPLATAKRTIQSGIGAVKSLFS